jgi:hypothetical protein
VEKKLRETLLDFLIRLSGKEPIPEKEVVHPPVVELELKALKPKKRIQEYNKELVVEEQVEQIGKHE